MAICIQNFFVPLHHKNKDMSIINRFLTVVTEPELKLARDLTAMAIADGEVTPEEKEAICAICHVEGIDERKLLENLKGKDATTGGEMPQTRRSKEEYLKNLIKLIGADGDAAPQEVYLFQIIAGKLGMNQMDVVGLFMLTTNHKYFRGDVGSKVLSSFLRNQIDPMGKTEKDNRDNLRMIYDTIASHTERLQDEEADTELLRQNLAQATETFLENSILMNGFKRAGLDFARILKEEETKVYLKYTR